ncbi:MAG: hypothetical protein ACO1QB_11480 [Verrucomicrobiales bacterium]
MLKRDPLGSFLAGAILLGTIATSAVCYWYLQCSRQHTLLQMEYAAINRNRAMAQQLAAEAVEYSKKNPSILPILNSVGIKPRTTANQEQETR